MRLAIGAKAPLFFAGSIMSVGVWNTPLKK